MTWYDSGDESERNTCHTIEYKFDNNNNNNNKKNFKKNNNRNINYIYKANSKSTITHSFAQPKCSRFTKVIHQLRKMYRKNIVHSCTTRIDVDSSLLRAWSIYPTKKSHDYLFEIIDRQTVHNLTLNLAAKNVLLLKSPRQYFLSPLTE